VIVNYPANDFYIPQIKDKGPWKSKVINRVNIKGTGGLNNSSKSHVPGGSSVDCLNMGLQHILDFVGQHHELKENNGKLSLKKGFYKGGLLY